MTIHIKVLFEFNYNYLTVLLIYWTDFYAAIFEKQSKVYQSWKGYPVAVFWYIFGISKYIIINYGSLGIVNCIKILLLPDPFFSFSDALFVHVYELNCAYILNDAWSLKRKVA